MLTLDILLATPAAWLTSRTNLRGRRFWTVLCVLPLAIPEYVMAYALLALGGNNGIVTQFFPFLSRVPRLSGYWGALLAAHCLHEPLPFSEFAQRAVRARPGFGGGRAKPRLSVSRSFSAMLSSRKLRPAFYASGLLISLHVLGDFGVVSLMRYESFSYALYTEYLLSFEHISAAWLALMLLAFTASLLYLEARLLKRVTLHRAGRGVAHHLSLVPLGGTGRAIAYFFLISLTFVTVAVPIGSVLFWMVSGDGEINAGLIKGLIGSLSVATPTSVLCAFLAVPFAYVSVRYPSRVSDALGRAAYIVYAIPPLAFALSLIFFVLHSVPFIYKTLPVLIYACTLHFLAEAIGPVRSSLYQASPHLEEAARSLGCSPMQAFFTTLFPLLSRGMLTATALVFLAMMKELPLTFLLSPAGYETLALNVWSYTTEAMFAEGAPYALAILLISAAFVSVLIHRQR